MKILEMQHITYAYNHQEPVLEDVNLTMETGKMYAILGPSGSGKTTLLSLAGGLDIPWDKFFLTENLWKSSVSKSIESGTFP